MNPDSSRRVISESSALLSSSSPASPTGSFSNDCSNGNPSNLRRTASATSSTPVAADSPLSVGRAVFIAFSIWILIFMQASNMSGMAMAQSAVAAELDAYEEAMWFTSIYLISSASFSPLMGRLASIFTVAHLIAASALCFAVGSVITARATSLAVFLTGRGIVGLGGAGVMTLSLITVLQLASYRRRGLFVGLINAGFTIGLSSGAVVYGALLPSMGWRMLFLVQAPVALLAAVAVLLSMHGVHSPPVPSDGGLSKHDDVSSAAAAAAAASYEKLTVWQKLLRIDYAGAVFLTLAIVFFLYGLSGSTVQLWPLYLSPVTLLLFVATETWFVPRFVPGGEPIVPLEVLRSRGVLLSCVAQLGVMAARWTVLYYAPIYVLAVRGFSGAAAGSVLIPTNLGFGSGGLVVGWLHVRRAGDFWLPSVVVTLLFSASLGFVGLLSRAAPEDGAAGSTVAYVLALFANGFCTGAYLNYTLAHLLHLTRPSTHYITSSLLATFRGFSASFGTAIGGGYFMRRLAVFLAAGYARLDGHDSNHLSPARRTLIMRLVGSPALVFGRDKLGHAVLSDNERAVAVAGYESALGDLYRTAALIAFLVIVLQAGTGWTAPNPKAIAAMPDETVNRRYAASIEEDEDEEEIREAIAEHNPTMEA